MVTETIWHTQYVFTVSEGRALIEDVTKKEQLSCLKKATENKNARWGHVLSFCIPFKALSFSSVLASVPNSAGSHLVMVIHFYSSLFTRQSS